MLRALLVFLSLSVVFVSGCKDRPSDSQVEALRARMAEVSKSAEALEDARAEAVRAFFSKPTVETSGCDPQVLLDAHDRAAVTSTPTATSQLVNFDAFALGEDPGGRPGQRIVEVREELQRLEDELAAERIVSAALPSIEADLAEYADASWHRYDIVYQVREITRDYAHEGKQFPSHVVGRALVWDYQQQAIACGAQFEKTLGDIEVYFNAGQVEPGKDDIEKALEYGLVHDVRSGTLNAMGLEVI